VLDALVAKDQRVIDGVTYKRCSDEDVCVDVQLTFTTDDDRLSASDVALVRHVARSIRACSNAATGIRPKLCADCRRRPYRLSRAGRIARARRLKYNWDLSAKRASAVMRTRHR
jgi:hypothetical protein